MVGRNSGEVLKPHIISHRRGKVPSREILVSGSLKECLGGAGEMDQWIKKKMNNSCKMFSDLYGCHLHVCDMQASTLTLSTIQISNNNDFSKVCLRE